MSHKCRLEATCRSSQWSEGGAVGPELPNDATAPQIQIDNAYCITFRHDRFNCESNRHVEKSLFTLRIIGKETLYKLRRYCVFWCLVFEEFSLSQSDRVDEAAATCYI